MIILNSSNVQQILDMKSCIDLMADAMVSFSKGESNTPPRGKYEMDGDNAIVLVMPASFESLGTYAIKLVNQHASNSAQGLPTFQGGVLVFDFHKGTPLGLVNASAITATRTAAVSALATRELAVVSASSHGILGTGAQAVSHLQAIDEVRDIKQVKVWARDYAKAEKFAQEHSSLVSSEILPVKSLEEANACDIVSAVTASTEPVVLHQFVKPGAHINLVGNHFPYAREVDSEIIRAAKVCLDSREAAYREAGDIIIPLSEPNAPDSSKFIELGELVMDKSKGREDDQQITVYKSLGLAIQDLYAVTYVESKLNRKTLAQMSILASWQLIRNGILFR